MRVRRRRRGIDREKERENDKRKEREKGKKDRWRQRNYRFLSYPTVTSCCSTFLYIFNFFLIYSYLLSNLPLCLFISFSLFSCLFPLLISISFNSLFLHFTGTTAAGLRAGKPTWICPFFGDQFFWGEMIRKGGLGPSPCSIRLLTLHIVAESLVALTDSKVNSCLYLYGIAFYFFYSSCIVFIVIYFIVLHFFIFHCNV